MYEWSVQTQQTVRNEMKLSLMKAVCADLHQANNTHLYECTYAHTRVLTQAILYSICCFWFSLLHTTLVCV